MNVLASFVTEKDHEICAVTIGADRDVRVPIDPPYPCRAGIVYAVQCTRQPDGSWRGFVAPVEDFPALIGLSV